MTAEPRPLRRLLGALGTAIVCLTILAASAAAIVIINKTEPTAQTINATRKSAALVEVLTARRGDYSPQLVVLGVVQAAQEIVLSPRVQGQVIEVAPRFVPGGMVRKGETLVRIDPADFENAVSIRTSELQQVQASLEIEEGRQSLARKELELLGETIGNTNRALVLRKPQYASIQAQINAAEAALERAQLDLERTTIPAPFDAQVLERSVNVGSQVSSSDSLGRLVGVDEYWIQAAVPVRNLRWIQMPKDGVLGSSVKLRDEDAWGVGVEREARVARLIGSLDRQSRMARVLITISDPLGQESQAPPLILGALIEARIEGRRIEDVVRLRREFVRDEDKVWVMKDNKLEIRETVIEFRDAQYAYIREGLSDGDEVVISTLATVADGVGLRRIDADTPASETDVESNAASDVEPDGETSGGATE